MGNSSKFKFKYVLFDPKFVGWDRGLCVAVEDAVSLKIPLAVKGSYTFNKVRKQYPDIDMITLE